MNPDRSALIKAFGAATLTYNEAAGLQRRIAWRLADRISALPLPPRPKILEIGCGTGFLSEALSRVFPAGDFVVTDIAPTMVAESRRALSGLKHARFLAMDGERPCVSGRFDLICSNFAIQWFDCPAASLQELSSCLAPGGYLAFTTLAEATFKEWRAAHAEYGVTPGTPLYLPIDALLRLPLGNGNLTVNDETVVEHYRDGYDFLRTLKRIGAQAPTAGHRPLSSSMLRRILLNFKDGASITYHVAYGTFRRELSVDDKNRQVSATA